MGEVMIENTVQFRFPVTSPRPSWVEIASFIKQLNTDVTLMETAYKTANDRSLFIKFSSHDAMMDALSKNAEPRPFVYNSGRSVEVCMAVAGINMRYVRVFDLPPELSDGALLSVLGEYGKVDKIVREKFPADLGLDHLCTGVRGVFMNVENDIPPSIDVAGRKANVFYDGLKDTCFLCQKTGHRKDSCPQRKLRNRKQNEKAQDKPAVSYATVVSGNQGTSGADHSTEVSPDEIIEVLDEEFLELPTESEGKEQVQAPVTTESALEKVMRRKENLEKLEEVAYAIKEAIENKTAKDRRAQFANSSSTSGSLPKKKVARRTFY